MLQQPQLSPRELAQCLETKEPLFLLDVRNPDELARWRIERKGGLPSLNIAYFEMLEKGGKEDFQDSIQEYIKKELAQKLPKDQKILVVCAKGGTSDLVARILGASGYKAFNLEGGMKAWGDFYDQKSLVASPDLSIIQCIRPSRGCLSYVIASGKEAIVIDPLRIASFYTNLFHQLQVKPVLVLDTHAHADHISGAHALSEQYKIPYHLHPYDGIHPLDMLPAVFSYEPSWEGKTYKVGKAELKTLHIPGHTLGNLAFLLNGKYLFSGDSIFLQSIARPDLGGRAKEWTPLHYQSLKKLLALPDETVVLPAHFSSVEESNQQFMYAGPLGQLKKNNEGLIMAGKSLEEFSSYILNHLPEFPPEYIEIKRVNIGLTLPDEEKASELELGKNICAVGTSKKE